MASKTVFEEVDGTLGTLVHDQYYVTHPVKLNLEVPDGGPYTLRYSHRGKKYEQLRLTVKFGVLMNAG